MKGYMNFKKNISISETASVAGKMEKEGPLSEFFDISDKSNLFGMKTWEEAESEMQRLAFNTVVGKSKLTPDDIDIVFSGDLMNQCVGGSYSFATQPVNYVGIYGACSTFPLGLALASAVMDGGFAERASVVTSSHYCSAERQFRTPLEYGSQRTPTAQWTVTGAGAAILSVKENTGVRVAEAYIGRIIDMGINDANNMGAAMAPAAADTLISYFKCSESKPSDFDAIFTGDLGSEGKSILRDLMKAEGYVLDYRYNDCGCMIYDLEKQDVHAGASGCASSACTFCAYIYKLMTEGKLNSILLIGTGALMSPQFLMQGKNIPSVAHLVHIVSKGGNKK